MIIVVILLWLAILLAKGMGNVLDNAENRTNAEGLLLIGAAVVSVIASAMMDAFVGIILFIVLFVAIKIASGE